MNTNTYASKANDTVAEIEAQIADQVQSIAIQESDKKDTLASYRSLIKSLRAELDVLMQRREEAKQMVLVEEANELLEEAEPGSVSSGSLALLD